MKQVIDIITGLKLRLNKKKTRIVNVNREYVMFLGFKLKRVAGKVMITPRMKSIKKFKQKIKQVTRRKQPVKPKEMIWRLNTIIQGWGNYYFIGTVKKLFERLDRWGEIRASPYNPFRLPFLGTPSLLSVMPHRRSAGKYQGFVDDHQ